MINPKEYLESLGIHLETTALITVIDGVMKQPDLCYLLSSYSSLVLLQKSAEATKIADEIPPKP